MKDIILAAIIRQHGKRDLRGDYVIRIDMWTLEQMREGVEIEVRRNDATDTTEIALILPPVTIEGTIREGSTAYQVLDTPVVVE